MSLQGRVVVVTGAARGLGEAMAVRLAARGARLVLVGLEPTRLAEVAARCGDRAAWFEADVTDATAISQVAAEVVRRFGRVDVLVANAGIATGGTLSLAEPVAYERVIEVNLLGSVRTVRAFLPHLVASRGYVLQVASLAAMMPAPMMSAYCASKAGVEAFAHCLRSEVRHHGVGVGIAYLSFTDTDMVRGSDESEALRHARSRFPPPFNRTYPLAPTADRLVEGIARRCSHVYGQGWVRWVQAVRGLMPSVTVLVAGRRMPRLERVLQAEGVRATLPAGSGGRADTSARSR